MLYDAATFTRDRLVYSIVRDFHMCHTRQGDLCEISSKIGSK